MQPDPNPGHNFFTSIHTGSYFYAGTVSFVTHYTDDYPILTRQDGGVFDLISIDLDSLYGAGSHVEFTGFFENGSTISQSFFLDSNRKNMETILFSEFTSVVAVSWDDLEFASLHHYDNIMVSSVPIPSTIILLSIGLLGLTGVSRREN